MKRVLIVLMIIWIPFWSVAQDNSLTAPQGDNLKIEGDVFQVCIQKEGGVFEHAFAIFLDSPNPGIVDGEIIDLKGVSEDFKQEYDNEMKSIWEKLEARFGSNGWDEESARKELKPRVRLTTGNLSRFQGEIQFTDVLNWSFISTNYDAAITRALSEEKASSTGESTVLVLHITTNDSQTTKTAAELSDDVFGTASDPVNLASQFDAVSHGAATFVPAVDDGIVDGVLEVTLDLNSNGQNNVVVRNAAIAEANDLLGYSIGSQFDHVMIAVPPGTNSGWIAYASVYSWMSVYNDGWVSSLSAQMHEVGHNIGLAHAGEAGQAYGDQSGMMGFSYGQDDGPVMGFNATKTWQLEWYPDAIETISMDQIWCGPWIGQLVGFVDYENASPGQNVALKVDTPDSDDTNIYISYNRKTDMNSGTIEGGDQVLIHSKAGDGYQQSWLIAKIGQGGSYTGIFPGMESTCVVTFIGTETSNGVQYANVKIVNENSTPPVADAGPDMQLDCYNTTVLLDGSYSTGQGDLLYLWSNGLETPSISVSLPGAYEVTVTDSANGCTDVDIVFVNENIAAPTADAGPDMQLDCYNTTVVLDGSYSTGQGDLLYLWSNGLETPSISVSLSGIYEITVTDSANGCTDVDIVFVNEDTVAPTADAGPDMLLDCSNTIVVLDGSYSTGQGDLIYLWSNGLETSSISVSLPGTYEVTVTDSANGCTDVDIVIVNENTAAPMADAGPDMLLDCSNTTVVLDGSNSTGQEDLIYLWSNGLETSSISVSLPGTYEVTVTDSANGCTNVDTVIVNENTAAPMADAGPDMLLDCSNTTVVLDGSNSTGQGDLIYLWSNGLETSSISVSLPGTYEVTVTDSANGCTDVDIVIVNENTAAPMADAGPDMQLDCYNTTVVLDGSSSTGQGDLIYLWSNGLETPSISVGLPGTYEVTVTDSANGCTDVDIVIVNENTAAPMADAGPDMQLDCSNTTVVLDGSSSTGQGDLIYLWSNGLETPSISVGLPGTYEVTMTDSTNGCTDVDIVIVNENTAAPMADAGPDMQLDCSNTTVVLDGSNSTGQEDLIYLWSNGLETSSISVGLPGTYEVTVTDSANGCTDVDEVIVTSIIIDGPTADFTYSGDGLTIDFLDNSIGATAYDWAFGDGNVSSDPNPSHTYTTGGDFDVQLIVSNACGMDTILQTLFIQTTELTELPEEVNLLNLYPNPNNGFFYLEVEAKPTQELEVRLYDVIGRQLMDQTFNFSSGYLRQGFNMDHLATGTYIVQLNLGENLLTRKLIVE